MGNLSFKEGNHVGAEQYYVRALEAVPGHPAASNNLAVVYVELDRRLEDAERLGLQALSHGGSLRPYILHTLASVYQKRGRYVEARSMLDEADALTPHNHFTLRDEIARSRQRLP